MDIPTTQRLRLVVAGVTILVFAGLIALVIADYLQRPNPPEPIDPAVEAIRPEASGVVFRLELAGVRRGTVSIEELVRQRRKLGPLTINPTAEYVMKGVRIELSLEQGEPSEGPPDVPFVPPLEEFTGQMLRREKLDPLTRLVIEGFEYVCVRSGETVVELTAERIVVEPGRGVQLSDGFSFATNKGQRLVGSRGSLNLNNDTLTVDASYAMHDGTGGGDVGQGATFLFDPSKLEIRKAPPVETVD